MTFLVGSPVKEQFEVKLLLIYPAAPGGWRCLFATPLM